MLDQVRRTIRRHAMLAGGETVLVAVSGGADSVALLHLLRALAADLRLRLHVLHVDHGLRPDSALDAEFVQDLGRRLGVPVDVAAVAVDRAGSLEAAARAARYRALDACADRVGAGRIALGHTADDQAETVLMRLLTGAGVRGLAAIPPVRGRIIRPLLECRRSEIVAELRRVELPWREDPSNLDPKFLRNRIRHELLPLLASTYDPAIAVTLGRVAALARETVDALEGAAAAELARLAAPEPSALTLPLPPLRRLPRPVAAEVLRQGAARLGGRAPLRAWGYRGLRRVLLTPAPRRAFRVGGVTVEVSGDRVRLGTAPPPPLLARAIPIPGAVPCPEIGLTLRARLAAGRGYNIVDRPDLAAFDADALAGPLLLRGRRRGDRLTVFGGGERRVKALLIDAKVPRWERDRVVVVEAGGQIVWIGGHRRGAAAPVTPHTERVLELALIPLWRPLPTGLAE